MPAAESNGTIFGVVDRITPKAAYTAAIAPGSEQHRRISPSEYGRIAEAFNRRSYAVDFMGVRAFEQTGDKQAEFLRTIEGENPALATALRNGENWEQYLGRRIRDDVRGVTAKGTVPEDLRREIQALGAQVRASTDEVLNRGDGKYFELFRSNHESAVRSPQGQALLQRLRDAGVRDPQQTMAKIMGSGG